jgi:hypothetical protein
MYDPGLDMLSNDKPPSIEESVPSVTLKMLFLF